MIRVFLFITCIMLTSYVYSQSAMGQEIININCSAKDVTLRSMRMIANPEGAITTRVFDWNPRLKDLTIVNEGSILQLDFFNDKHYKAIISNVTRGYDGVLGITAVLTDFDFSACFIAISDAGITILTDIPERDERYRAFTCNGETILSRYSLMQEQKKETPHIAVPFPDEPSNNLSPQLHNTQVETRADDNIDEPVVIDVMVVYTSAAKQWAIENRTSIENNIRSNFQYANYVLENSRTNLTLNMVYKYETDYRESGDYSTDLGAIQGKTDGNMDEIHALRKQYRADLVAMITSVGGAAAFMPNENNFYNYGSCELGFSIGVNDVNIHEIGHNLGCGHNWEQIVQPGPGIFNYSSGYRGKGKNGNMYGTLMTYQGVSFHSDSKETIGLPYFSNPDIIINGVSIGDNLKANNALTIKRTKHTISRYSDYLNQNISDFEVTNGVLTKYKGLGGNVAIPPTGITSIGQSVFENCETLTGITISKSVTNIGDFSFRGCTNLSTVIIPSDVSSVGESAFSGCAKLAKLYVNWETPILGVQANAFSNIDLTSCILIVPVGSKNKYKSTPIWSEFGIIKEADENDAQDFIIENGVLKKYTGRDMKVVIPDTVTSIGDNAFAYNFSLANIIIPNSVVSIGNNAFEWNSSLSELHIPSYVSSIGSMAFWCCDNLIKVTIPESVTSIESAAFGYCSSLAAFDVSEQNPAYSTMNGVLFDKYKTVLYSYAGPEEKFYTVPEGVTSIATAAFAGKAITGIFIPNSVTTIGGSAFARCNITNLNIGNSVTEIEGYAFEYCTDLTEIYCKNETPPKLGEHCFDHVKKTCKLYVPFGSKSAYQDADGWKDFNIIESAATGILPVSEELVSVNCYDGNLTVSSPSSETVSIYSLNGALLFKAQKKSEQITIPIINKSKQVLIVNGSSGWSRKIVMQ